MGFTNFPNGITSFGAPVFGSGGFPMSATGSHFWVDSVYGSDSNDGTEPTKAKKKLSAGYALMTTNKHDVLHVIGGASAYAETSILTMDKNYCHIVAHSSPLYNGGRARVTNTTTVATAGEYVFSGTGCTVSGMHFQFGDSATATSLVGFALSGNGRNAFINCEFDGPFDAGIGAAVGQRMMTITSSQDNMFYGCSFGQRTILNTSATGAVLEFCGSNNNGNVFEECMFHSYNSNTAAGIISLVDGALPTSGYIIFRRCTMMNHTAVSMADAIRNTTTAAGMIFCDDSKLCGLGTTVWATNLKTNIFVTGANSANKGGVAIVST